jgi:peptide/nickel transport system substrate-binding protein
MRLIANRPQMVANALNGHGRIGNDVYATDDPLSTVSNLPQRHQDIEQAKSLLKAAGQSDLRVTLTTSELQAGIVAASEAFASAAAQAGVKVQLNQLDPGQFYGSKGYLSYPFGVDYFAAFPYANTATVTQLPGAIFNTMHWNDPQWEAAFQEFLKTQSQSLKKELLHKMQTIDYERGGYIVWGFADTLDAATSRVHGFKPHPTGHNFGYESLWRLWLQ